MRISFAKVLAQVVLSGMALVGSNPSLASDPRQPLVSGPILFVDSAKIYSQASRKLGYSGERLRLEINERLRLFAEVLQVDVIFQTAVYASDRVNTTQDFLTFLDTGNIEHIKSAAPQPRIGFVDTRRLLESAKRGGLGDGARAISTLNKLIVSLAQSEKLDLIFQEAVWANPAIDLTERLIVQLK